MLENIKSIITDFHETPGRQAGITRRMQIEVVPGKATVCIGVRRCGKSTYMLQRIDRLQESGVQRKNIVYLNFFDDRLHELQHGGLGRITDAYYSLYPEKKGVEKVHYFFDEVQVVPSWESFVDRLMRTENCDVYLTGSSAEMLSREVATQMRGRSLSWELFPFSFQEFLDWKAIEATLPWSTKTRFTIQKAFEEYWETGGFPEVLGLSKALRIRIHQEYFHAILGRDVIERHDVSHPRALTDLAHWLVDNVASLYSVNRLTGYLQSLGHKAPKSAVSDYLEWFEDAYFLFTVRIFDSSLARSKTNPKKVYCVDHSLVTSVSSGVLVNAGHFLENLVFVALRREHSEICYYRTRGGREVDFIVPHRGGAHLLVQVCESLVRQETKEREIRALQEAMAELGVRSGVLVTRQEQESIDVDAGRIEIVPIWRFLLEVPVGV